MSAARLLLGGVCLGQAATTLFVGAETAAGSCEVDDSCQGDEETALLQARLSSHSHNATAALEHPTDRQNMEADPWAECRTSDTNDCSLDSMSGPTLVYPGGETKCLDGGEYAFAVNPGEAKDKFVFVFGAAGICFEVNGETSMRCVPSLTTAVLLSGLGAGIHNREHDENPFKSHTIVTVLYCTGDYHGGDVKQAWGYQKGYHNALSAVDWTRKNTPKKLKELVLSGVSTGTLGAMLWAPHLLEVLPAKHSTVLLDSDADVFPKGVEGHLAKAINSCNLPILSHTMQRECSHGRYHALDNLAIALKANCKTQFGMLQSKVDENQIWVFQTFATSFGWADADALISGEEFYHKSMVEFKEMSHFANFHYFLVSGDTHTFTFTDDFYTATTAGATGVDGGKKMIEWVGDLVAVSCMFHHSHLESECFAGPSNSTEDSCILEDFRRKAAEEAQAHARANKTGNGVRPWGDIIRQP